MDISEEEVPCVFYCHKFISSYNTDLFWVQRTHVLKATPIGLGLRNPASLTLQVEADLENIKEICDK